MGSENCVRMKMQTQKQHAFDLIMLHICTYVHVKLIDYLGQPQPKVEYIHFREYIQ